MRSSVFRNFLILQLAWLTSACGGGPQCPTANAPEDPIQPGERRTKQAEGSASEAEVGQHRGASLAGLPERRRPFAEIAPQPADWSQHFQAEQVGGAFVLYDSGLGEAWTYAEQVAKTPYLPASTYKIPHTIIALELGIVADADFVLPWDGERRWNPDWNFDTSLREAMRFSVVPYYQEVARRIGVERMSAWLQKLDYGNRNIDGGIDLFWLTGKLRVSGYEQVAFLQRLNEGLLPVSERTRGIVREILVAGRRGAAVLRGKTGSAEAVEGSPAVKWYVGWVESPGKAPVYFATILNQAPANAWSASRLVTDRILSERGYL